MQHVSPISLWPDACKTRKGTGAYGLSGQDGACKGKIRTVNRCNAHKKVTARPSWGGELHRKEREYSRKDVFTRTSRLTAA